MGIQIRGSDDNISASDGSLTIDGVNFSTLQVNGQNLPTAGPLSNRNLVINGAMQVSQRGTSESGLTDSPVYLVDRFSYRRQGSWGSNSFTMSQQSSGAPAGFTHFLRLAQSGTAAAPPTDTWCSLATYLEGNAIYQANFGTSDAQPLTVSFYARASQAGTYCFSLQNGDADQSFVAENSVTTNWQRFTVNIPARTTGTWATNNSLGFQMYWIVAADSNGAQSGSTGWTAGNVRYSTSQLETFASTSGATFDLCGVQLEVGTVATPFEHRSYGDELARCQRYYYRITGSETSTSNVGLYGIGFSQSSTAGRSSIHLPVTMRTFPEALEQSGTASHYRIVAGSSGSIVCSAVPTFTTSSTKTLDISWTVASGATANQGVYFMSNSASSYIGVSAEL